MLIILLLVIVQAISDSNDLLTTRSRADAQERAATRETRDAKATTPRLAKTSGGWRRTHQPQNLQFLTIPSALVDSLLVICP